MNKLIQVFFGLSLVFQCLLTSSCNKEEANMNPKDCVFIQNDGDRDGLIDETERNIMTDCISDPLLNIEDIEDNLIGEWNLIGHGEGWIPTVSKPCAYLEIAETELSFHYNDAFIDTTIVESWKIEQVDGFGGPYFTLRVDEATLPGLSINQFCTDYMYVDATEVDGNMYLYEKVK